MSNYDYNSGEDFNEGSTDAKNAVNKGKNVISSGAEIAKESADAIKKAPETIKKTKDAIKKGTEAFSSFPTKTLLDIGKKLGIAVGKQIGTLLVTLCMSIGGMAILLLVVCILIMSLFSGFQTTENISEMPGIYDTMRNNFYAILSGKYETSQGDLIGSGQNLWDGAYRKANEEGEKILQESYGDYDSSNVTIETEPNTLTSVVDTVTIYFLAVNTTIFHHTNESSSEDDLEKELKAQASDATKYLQDQVNEKLLENFFKLGTPSINVRLKQTKNQIDAGTAKQDSWFMKKCNGKGYVVKYLETNPNGSSTYKEKNMCSIKVKGVDKEYGTDPNKNITKINGIYDIGSVEKYEVDKDKYKESIDVDAESDEENWQELGYYRFYDGTITFPLEYDLGEYRKKEIENIVKKESKEKGKSEDEIRENLDKEINGIITANTEILDEQGALKTDSDFARYNITGLTNITTTDGWTFPTHDRVGINAGTWHYPSGGEHRGIDLAVPLNTELLAVGDGVILRAADGVTTGGLGNYASANGGTQGGGNCVLLLTSINDKLYAVKYLHMSKGLSVTTGQSVKAGDVIGHSGSTGNSSGPHCHIEVMYLGSADNFASFAASWDGDWTCGTSWNLSRTCDKVDAPCKVRPEEVFGF